MGTASQPCRPRQPKRRRHVAGDAAELRQRTLRLLHQEIDFIPHPSFREPGAEDHILGQSGETRRLARQRASALPNDMPAHLARLCDGDLLDPDAEQDLFRRMNYLKFRANSIRCRLDPDAPSEDAVAAAECYLNQALAVRDRLIRSNMRLVISIVKKFVSPQYSFDELLSEGSMSLLQAVEKFDFSRGFRFSTYAYRAIARNAFRKVADRQKEGARFLTGTDETIFNAVRDDGTSPMSDHARDRLRQLMSAFVHRLDRRERFIVRSRYALGAHRKTRTFQCLADKLGVSKERVRQLEQRAVAKLRSMAAEASIDELVDEPRPTLAE